MKVRLVMGAFIALVSACGDSAGTEKDGVGGDGGHGGTAGADGVAGTAGDGGTAGSAGSAGSGGAAPIERALAEYYVACLRDEPDDVFAECLERRVGHFERECGRLHLDHFVCLNDGNGADPRGDCERLLGDWVACVDEEYPAVRVPVACSDEVKSRYRQRSYEISATTYRPTDARAPNEAQRETHLEICDVERQFIAPECVFPEYSSSHCVDVEGELRPCTEVLGALANTDPGCRPIPDDAPCRYRDLFSREKLIGEPACVGIGGFEADDVFEVQTSLRP